MKSTLGAALLVLTGVSWLCSLFFLLADYSKVERDAVSEQAASPREANEAIVTPLANKQTAHVTSWQYREINTLSDGPMTKVDSVYDAELRRTLVRKELKDASHEEEFIDESRKATTLSDLPYYVQIYGANFRTEGIKPHVIMQYIPNGTLREYIDNNIGHDIDIKTIRRIVSRVGAAIISAHEREFSVGNIKPSNIILDNDDEPYLSPNLHRTYLEVGRSIKAVRAGTVSLEDLAYAPPELFQLDRSSNDPRPNPQRMDQYSLGLLAYHLATGTLPETLPRISTRSPTAHCADLHDEVLKRGSLAFQELQPLHSVRKDVPKIISDIIARMTARRPGDRYDTVEEAMQRLRKAERWIIDTARDSYVRCLSRKYHESFFAAFYREFTSKPSIHSQFVSLDPNSWTAQHGKLQRAIEASFDFANDTVADKKFSEPNAMTGYARHHAELAIGENEYADFVDALVRTVAGGSDRPPYQFQNA